MPKPCLLSLRRRTRKAAREATCLEPKLTSELKPYIVKRFGQDTWCETLQTIKSAVRDTVVFPFRAHIPPELAELSLTQYRQVLAGMNRVIDEVRSDCLYIHVVPQPQRSAEFACPAEASGPRD